ncbi:hypothetical protein KIN20_017692 [Parelaphostrongylus tenuis]|uniref:Uncharacterized protein n=1 Tax=Parelaphostrongylus tenuis TaxID=148309 RepID=A0AAD5QQY4_PARTN|nr:hypothetical protein KIN20_017692 [Parelaphostrongylus tenuis]
MQETWVHPCIGDPMEKEKATHSSILARRSPNRFINIHLLIYNWLAHCDCRGKMAERKDGWKTKEEGKEGRQF